MDIIGLNHQGAGAANAPAAVVISARALLWESWSHLQKRWLMTPSSIARQQEVSPWHAAQEAPEEGAGLAISGGQQGARLTHNHARQYAYVLQSLMLWCARNLAQSCICCLEPQHCTSNASFCGLVAHSCCVGWDVF